MPTLRALLQHVLAAALLVAPARAYVRSSTACAGTLQLASESECQTAVARLAVAGAASASSVGQEWPQGCFYHNTGGYYAPDAQTGTNTPTPGDGLAPYICRSGYEMITTCGASAGVTDIADCMPLLLASFAQPICIQRSQRGERITGRCAKQRSTRSQAMPTG